MPASEVSRKDWGPRREEGTIMAKDLSKVGHGNSSRDTEWPERSKASNVQWGTGWASDSANDHQASSRPSTAGQDRGSSRAMPSRQSSEDRTFRPSDSGRSGRKDNVKENTAVSSRPSSSSDARAQRTATIERGSAISMAPSEARTRRLDTFDHRSAISESPSEARTRRNETIERGSAVPESSSNARTQRTATIERGSAISKPPSEARTLRNETIERGSAISESRSLVWGDVVPNEKRSDHAPSSRSRSQSIGGDTKGRFPKPSDCPPSRSESMGGNTRGRTSKPSECPPSRTDSHSSNTKEAHKTSSCRNDASSRALIRPQQGGAGTVTQMGVVQDIHNRDINKLARRVDDLEDDLRKAEERAEKAEADSARHSSGSSSGTDKQLERIEQKLHKMEMRDLRDEIVEAARARPQVVVYDPFPPFRPWPFQALVEEFLD